MLNLSFTAEPREQGNCCHWELVGKDRQNGKMLEEAALLRIRNTPSVVGAGRGRMAAFCMKNSLSKSHTALFEDAIFSCYFN